MFERFTDPITIVRMIQQGDLSRLRKVISAGAKIDRRTSGEPWMTPLDAAASSQDTQAVALLLAAGAPIYGSSIYDAIAKDAVRVLQSFHSHDPRCCIPDDCIDSKRYPLFMARSVLQELIKSLQSTQGVKPC